MKTFLKTNNAMYPATFRGWYRDENWNGRDSIAATLEMTYEEAAQIFVDDLQWGLRQEFDTYVDGLGNAVTPEPEETDYSEYSKAGSFTDNRDGTVTVKMGKITAEEALAELMEVLA